MRRKLFLSSTVLFVLLSLVVVVEADSLMWSQTYGDTGLQSANSLVVTSDGGYAFAGYNTLGSLAENTECFWLVKTDPLGNIEWNQTYGEKWTYTVNSVVAMFDGGYALAGSMRIIEPFCRKAWLAKTDEFGVVPEYSSWLLPSILLVATLVAAIYKKRLFNQRSKMEKCSGR